MLSCLALLIVGQRQAPLNTQVRLHIPMTLHPRLARPVFPLLAGLQVDDPRALSFYLKSDPRILLSSLNHTMARNEVGKPFRLRRIPRGLPLILLHALLFPGGQLSLSTARWSPQFVPHLLHMAILGVVLCPLSLQSLPRALDEELLIHGIHLFLASMMPL